MRGPTDPYPSIIAQVIQARISGDEEATRRHLAEMPFIPPERRTERWPAMSVIAAIYCRDHYQCRYCGERLILTALMRLVARLYPQHFPYHPNWKLDSTHPAFISRSATLDHVEPVAGGGDPIDPKNLVTACWVCNRRKGDLDLNEIGWKLVPPRDPDWMGLTELFRPLWEAAGRPRLSDDEASWMRAVQYAARGGHC